MTHIDDSTQDFPYVDDEADLDEIYKLGVAADSGCGEALMGSGLMCSGSGPSSLASVTLRRNFARSMTDDSSVASRGSSSIAPKKSDISSRHLASQKMCKSLSPQPVPSVPFRTFRPLQASQNNLVPAVTGSDAFQGQSLSNGSAKKRASTVELNGECYLAIETAEALAASAARLDPAVYRGGVGSSPPKQGLELQQRLLEESLNNTDYIMADDSRLSMRRHSRERASMLNISSKGPLFRPNGQQRLPPSQNSSSYYNSLPRRKPTKSSVAKYKKLMAQWSLDPDRTDVANKSSEMLT
jgi:hypothetical protein